MFVQIIQSLFEVRYQCFLRAGHIQLQHFPLKPLLRSHCCYFSNFSLKEKKCWSWHCVLLACHHQVCAVNTAGQNLQSSLQDQQQQLVHGHDWDSALCLSHSIVCTVSCYFRGIYVIGFGLVSTSNRRSTCGAPKHPDRGSQFLNLVFHSDPYTLPCRGCYLDRFMSGRHQMQHNFSRDQSLRGDKIDRWRGGTRGSMRSDSRPIV